MTSSPFPYTRNQRGAALMLSMIIMVLISMMALYLLEKIVPFSKDTKGIENGNIAYYRANTALNEALLGMAKNTPGIEPAGWAVANSSGMLWSVSAMGRKLPMPGQGNSEYNKNWSILAAGKPIQLLLPAGTGVNWATSSFVFRVPDLDADGNNTSQSLIATGAVVNWTLVSSGETLVSKGSQIIGNEINNLTSVSLGARTWVTLSGTLMTFSSFYGTKCLTQICTLKLFLLNPLLLNDNVTIAPHLEYQANMSVNIPLQTATVDTQGYAGGFRQNIKKYVQEATTNEIIDFTVFQ